MITSLQQKNKALDKLNRLQAQLSAPAKPGVPESVLALNNAQVSDSISMLQADIDAFDAACETDLYSLEFSSYEDLCRLPIVVRLASDMTLPDFAKTIGVSESQLKRYEANEYHNAPSHVFSTVLTAFNITLNGRAQRSA